MEKIDEVATYWNARPCNIRHSNKEVGTKEYFDEVERRKYFVEPHIPSFAEFSRWKGKRVLEIGCGIGTDTINFARAGAIVTAVDLSKESLAIAKKRAEVFGLEKNISFYQANAEILSETIPPPQDSYDLIYSFGVIHHTPNPENAIKQIRKYMDKNTVLKIMLYNKLSWKVLWILLTEGKLKFWKLNELIAKNSEAQTGCPVTYTYTKNSVRKFLSGFQISKSFYEHIFPYSIPEYKEYKYKKVWYFRIMPNFMFRILESLFGWHLCVEAKLNYDG
jgi:2-polyprenyl-3-methyl-5-hydroxy-6-metoxy-1,4-benzoquinol methylase